jgi:predicted ATPase
VQKSILLSGGKFVVGKFDQLERHVTYCALTDAFSKLINQIKLESNIVPLQKRLLSALGSNAQLIIDLIPVLQDIIGKQPALPNMSPQEHKNLFLSIFPKFMTSFIDTTPGSSAPLVLFLDDIQWADRETIEMIKYLLENPRCLFIGSYRDNEVSSTHPAMQAIDDIRKEKITVHNVFLKPLSFSVVNRLISDTLRASYPDFAQLVHEKTEGNPFFVKQFLQSLHGEGLLVCNESSNWSFDLDKIRSHPATDNVIDLMVHRMKRIFTGRTSEVMQWAACFGASFSVEKLAAVVGLDRDQIMEDLFPALEMTMLIKGDAGMLTFTHDRVQEACYSTLTSRQKSIMHYIIGKKLLESEDISIDQLNKASTLLFIENEIPEVNITSETRISQIHNLACLNLAAGNRTLKAVALSSCLNYYQAGIDCFKHLGVDSWENYHSLGFELHMGLATT